MTNYAQQKIHLGEGSGGGKCLTRDVVFALTRGSGCTVVILRGPSADLRPQGGIGRFKHPTCLQGHWDMCKTDEKFLGNPSRIHLVIS